MNTIIRLNAGILPDAKTAHHAQTVSEGLHRTFRSQVVLNPRDTLAHITLYMGDFPIEAISDIEAALRKISTSIRPFTLKIGAPEIRDDGTLFWRIRKSDPLMALHKKVVKGLSPLRDGHVRQGYLDSLDDFKVSERKNIEKYGAPHVMGRYLPHLTLSKLRKTDLSALKMAPANGLGFKATYLALSESGNHGTCRRVLTPFLMGQRVKI